MDCTHSTKRQKKGHNDPDMVPLDRHIELKREKLVADRCEAPKLREEAKRVREEYENVTQRWLIRKKKRYVVRSSRTGK